MSKVYFCNKILENGSICGERELSKFIEGRYTTCKPCRLRNMSQYNKSKTSKKKDVESTKIDPDCNIRYLIEDTIKRIPFMGGETIPERIESSEEDISNVFEKVHAYFDKNNKTIERMQKEIDELKSFISDFKK